jgi:hypothetical protein
MNRKLVHADLVAARFNASVFGCSFTGAVDSNGYLFLVSVVRMKSFRRADPSSREVLLCVSVCV